MARTTVQPVILDFFSVSAHFSFRPTCPYKTDKLITPCLYQLSARILQLVAL